MEEKLITTNLGSMKKNIKQEPDYLDDKNNLFDLVNVYKNSKWQEMEELHDKITSLAISKKWSRKKLDFMLHEIVMENGKVYSEELFDLLTNYLDNIEGNVSSNYIVRLYGDPENKEELSSYVRSGRWKEDDFFS